MFKATYHVVKAQLASFITERQTYAKIILAPLCTLIVLGLINLFITPYIKDITYNYSVMNATASNVIAVKMILACLLCFYTVKSCVLLSRFLVNKEQPTSVFSLHLFKQSYLVAAYKILFIIFCTMVSGLFGLILSFLINLYVSTWYTFNIISVATDKHVDFFKVSCQIGKTAFMNLLINIYVSLLVLVLTALITLVGIMCGVKLSMTGFALPCITYIYIFILLGCYSRSFTIWQKEHLANS